MNNYEKVNFNGIDVLLRVIDINTFFSLGKVPVTSVFCLPVKDNKIFLTRNPRGWDFIGGHVENNESPYYAMLREAMEEGSVEVFSSKILGIIEVFNPEWNKDSKYPETAYQIFYKTENFKLHDFKGDFECVECDFFCINELNEIHHSLLESHKKLIELI